MAIIDNAIYVDGVRVAEPGTLAQTYGLIREHDGIAWIGLYRPTMEDIDSLATEFGLHHLAVEDAISAHQRPKIERYDNVLFTVLRPARYIDAEERVEFGELHVFVGPDFVITIRHAESSQVGVVRSRLEKAPELLRMGPEAILYAILDRIVDEYEPVARGLENDIDEIEDQIFTGDTQVARRIYALSETVIEFQRAIRPIPTIIEALQRGFGKYQVDVELQRYLRDVLDHALRLADHVDQFRATLQTALTVHFTLVAQQQNEEMRNMTAASLAQNEQVKSISSWAAILFAPTLVGTVYGMNFEHMPELHWTLGYPMAISMMLLTGLTLFAVFKHNKWL
ncbi:magnesium and cobalt transport protein CorA [Lolliginicoccus levis]|uniref:magnesium and cobalt transport protein CorA n=1 Tax=Lolliginicoccus levis TaxID=2919542 RepID=UPI00241D3949|nr:magnesium and cobalt transport protein CorA [Lolliginicoccus levis]